MKPIKTKTFFVQNFLIAASVFLAVVGFLFAGKVLNFWPVVWGYLIDGETKFPIVLGVIPLSHLLYFFSFIFLYLLFEMYGFKSAFYTLLNMALMLAACYGLILLLQRSNIDPLDNEYDVRLKSLFAFGKRDIASIVAALLAGHTVSLCVAAALRVFTRSYLMFFRYILASALGFAVLVIVKIHIYFFDVLAWQSQILYAATPLVQYLALIVASVVPLYLLRLVLGIFRGSLKNPKSEKESPQARKSIYKTETPDLPVIPEVIENKASAEIKPESPRPFEIGG